MTDALYRKGMKTHGKVLGPECECTIAQKSFAEAEKQSARKVR